MIILIITAAILVIMGMIILIGKGDNLIAGYNSVSDEEKSQYNIKRLRGLIGGLLVFISLMLLLLLWKETLAVALSSTALTIVACIAVVILANTWAQTEKN